MREPERVRLTGGALAGVTARLVISPLGQVDPWAYHDGLLVKITGVSGRERILEVANSLQPTPR